MECHPVHRGVFFLTMEQQNQQQPLQIKATDERLAGTYANMAQIAHTREEFVMDFMNVLPPQGTLVSRVIMSPGHSKRLLQALADNIRKYEERFGPIHSAEEPKTQFGFPVK